MENSHFSLHPYMVMLHIKCLLVIGNLLEHLGHYINCVLPDLWIYEWKIINCVFMDTSDESSCFRSLVIDMFSFEDFLCKFINV